MDNHTNLSVFYSTIPLVISLMLTAYSGPVYSLDIKFIRVAFFLVDVTAKLIFTIVWFMGTSGLLNVDYAIYYASYLLAVILPAVQSYWLTGKGYKVF